MFEDFTYEQILDELLESVPDDIDKRESSIIYSALAPAAAKISQLYIMFDRMLELAFPQTSEGEYLDKIVEEEGISRKKATPSIRHFQADGSNGQIMEGYRFFVDGIYFVAKETINIPGVFKAESEEVGSPTAIYNPENILPLDNIDGLESIYMLYKHPDDIDGIDEETDEQLLQRYWERVRNSPGPGNISDYVRWAKEVTGVGNVLVDPLWAGEGTVRLVILNQDGKEASQQLIEDVQQIIDPDSRGIGEGKAPVGARVTVTTASVKLLSVIIPNLKPDQGYTIEQARQNAQEALKNYLRSINPGGVIRVKEAEAEIINALGVLDIDDISIEGKRENIYLDINELVDLKEVLFI